MGKQAGLRKNDVLSCSEIGRFMYCSVSWYLQRCGYEPESPFLEPGKQAHAALGDRMDVLERKIRFSWWAAGIGVLLLCAALVFFVFGGR